MDNTIYNEQEKIDLDDIRNIRRGLIKQMTQDGLPKDSKYIRLLNEVMMSAEDSIHKGVENKIKYADVQSSTETKGMIAEMLKQVSLQRMKSNSDIGVDNAVINPLDDTDMVPGELDTEPVELDANEFMMKKIEE